MSARATVLDEYQEQYGVAEADLLPAGSDARDEVAVVLAADADYELDRPGAFGLVPAECALLVVDMQESFVRPGGPMWVPHAQRLLPAVGEMAALCRGLGVPVFFTAATYLPRHPNDTKAFCAPVLEGELAEGSPGGQVASGLCLDGDKVVRTKYTYNAFFGTELHGRLQGLGVRTVIVTGTLTNFCCEATARGAFDLGYHVVFASDLTATDSAAAHRATLRTLRRGYARVMSAAEIRQELSSPGA
jgi:nicotinamidase-related amidase